MENLCHGCFFSSLRTRRYHQFRALFLLTFRSSKVEFNYKNGFPTYLHQLPFLSPVLIVDFYSMVQLLYVFVYHLSILHSYPRTDFPSGFLMFRHQFFFSLKIFLSAASTFSAGMQFSTTSHFRLRLLKVYNQIHII